MEQTLLLNATYEPLKVVHWQKAVTLMCQGKVEVISEYDHREIRSVKFSFRLPSVIRLLRYIRIKRTIDYVPFSRANIYARDDHSCQYCGEVFATSELTFDHVVPVAQGGRKDWENIVTCCITCNRKKGGVPPRRLRCTSSAFRSVLSGRRRFGLRLVSATPRIAGGITSTGTWSSTKRDQRVCQGPRALATRISSPTFLPQQPG